MDLMIFISPTGNIIFQPAALLKNGFIQAKKWANQKALEKGIMPDYMFNKNNCRLANAAEKAQWNKLLAESPHAVNIEK